MSFCLNDIELTTKIVYYRDAELFTDVSPLGTLITWALAQSELLSDYIDFLLKRKKGKSLVEFCICLLFKQT